MSASPTSRMIETSIAITLLLLLVFASPLLDWWSRSGLPWYTPYLFWFGIIVITAIIQIYRNKHDI